MAKKKTVSFGEINSLLDRANEVLGKGKTEIKKRKGCKNHPERLIYRNGECQECDAKTRNLLNKKNAEKEPWISTDGYKRIYREDGSIAMYHRFVIEQSIGRRLERKEVVKFKDLNIENCELNNLILISEAGDFLCKHCGKEN